ncbi:MAG: phosphatase PAP2 family protein [Ilumatobacter sp.]|uniref:phosphatase PAP2 family protein n=1 Tax=Ilumatobacter sp. TaxID=1967498 RepID=UPI00260B6EE6|nr:phosphatase PAP2 family protein [Ilumatobacter sp.]MDJ0770287.1 phosphatase PAP2 family protein [Ilumatobacter sp.]
MATAGDTGSSEQFFEVRDRLSLRTLAVILVVSVAAVLWGSAIAWDGEVPEWEADILRWINGWPDWLEPPMWVLQQVGVFAAPAIGGTIIVVVFTRRWQHLVPFLLVGPLKLTIEKGIVKQLVERSRPYESIGPEIQVRGPNFEGLAYPSGHCTTAFAFAVLVSAFLPPRWRPLPWAWAVIVAIARMYYGEHNVLDTVTGAALGTAFASVLWFAFLNREADRTAALRASRDVEPQVQS